MSSVSQVAASDIDRPTSAPPSTAANGTRPAPYATLAPALSTPDRVPSARAPGAGGRARGMQLGASKLPASALHMPAEWAEEAAAEAEAEEGGQSNPWGNDDLMDVNADQDDWSGLCFCVDQCRS